jgi:tRNA uridine 5-carboxymethylaminomethyl modification enzyme
VHPIQGTVARLHLDESPGGPPRVLGVETIEGRRFGARAIVMTSGTFGRGRMHIGTDRQLAGGRAGEPPVVHLAEQLEALGLDVGRFKTGTPPRIDGRTVDFSGLARQDSEIDQFDYSWSHFWPTRRVSGGGQRHPQQIPCWITFLEESGKQIIADHIGESAMYGGAIASRGPRYCPSVEDKIVKFPDAARHQIFLEPEGGDTAELYVNGLSTSLPAPVQLAVLRTVAGLENVRMTRAGYAIEYDYYPPTQLDATLAVRAIGGLYFAGQVNGTTGYEEAAGQGVVAGINAALGVLDREPLVLGRETSYIGVLVDDLVTRGVDEPYRLFTSRSEFRLTVRQDNALARLGPIANTLGLYDGSEREVFERRSSAEVEARELATSTLARPEQVSELLRAAGSAPITQPVRVVELARRQGLGLAALFAAVGLETGIPSDALTTAELEIKYQGYFERERLQADRVRRMGEMVLDETLPFADMRSLTLEARQKLATIRPRTLAQAARISGVSPSDVQNLVIEIERRRRSCPPQPAGY